MAEKSLIHLVSNIMRPEGFSLDPDDQKDIDREKLFFDLATPYEEDLTGSWRPQLVAACKEVKGLNACLTLGERQRMKDLKKRKKLGV